MAEEMEVAVAPSNNQRLYQFMRDTGWLRTSVGQMDSGRNGKLISGEHR